MVRSLTCYKYINRAALKIIASNKGNASPIPILKVTGALDPESAPLIVVAHTLIEVGE